MKAILYRHFSKNGTLLYVGASLGVLQRQINHASVSEWFGSVSRIELEHFANKKDLLAAERLAILNENPKHNFQFTGRVKEVKPFVPPFEIVPYEKWSNREKTRYAKLTERSKRFIAKATPDHNTARILRLSINTICFIKSKGVVPWKS